MSNPEKAFNYLKKIKRQIWIFLVMFGLSFLILNIFNMHLAANYQKKDSFLQRKIAFVNDRLSEDYEYYRSLNPETDLERDLIAIR